MRGIIEKFAVEETGRDCTEAFRRQRLAELTPGVGRAALERRYGIVLNSKELADSFMVIGFVAPLVVVQRKVDGVVGTLEFQHEPRLYFNWREDV